MFLTRNNISFSTSEYSPNYYYCFSPQLLYHISQKQNKSNITVGLTTERGSITRPQPGNALVSNAYANTEPRRPTSNCHQ